MRKKWIIFPVIFFFLSGLVSCKFLFQRNDPTFLECYIDGKKYTYKPIGPVERTNVRAEGYHDLLLITAILSGEEQYSISLYVYDSTYTYEGRRFDLSAYHTYDTSSKFSSVVLSDRDLNKYFSYDHSGWIEITGYDTIDAQYDIIQVEGKFEAYVRNKDDTLDVKHITGGKFRARSQ